MLGGLYLWHKCHFVTQVSLCWCLVLWQLLQVKCHFVTQVSLCATVTLWHKCQFVTQVGLPYVILWHKCQFITQVSLFDTSVTLLMFGFVTAATTPTTLYLMWLWCDFAGNVHCSSPKSRWLPSLTATGKFNRFIILVYLRLLEEHIFLHFILQIFLQVWKLLKPGVCFPCENCKYKVSKS